jgi:hypothetical protein
MPFIQIVEYKTSRIDELNAALAGRRADRRL